MAKTVQVRAPSQPAAQFDERSKIEDFITGADQAAQRTGKPSSGSAAESTLQPAASLENAGNTIWPGPTRKHGAAIPCQRNTG